MVAITPDVLPVVQPSPGYWAQVGRRLLRDKVTVICGIILLLIILAAIFAPYLGLADPYRASIIRRLRPIGTPGYLLGTDEQGRDMLARLVYGGRISLAVGLAAMFVAIGVGVLIGAISGMASGRVDAILMWFADLFLSLPQLPLLLLVIYLFRDALKNLLGLEMGVFVLIVLVIGGLRWMPVARLVRAQFLSLREKEFVEAARALGASRLRLVIRHILPNAMGPVIVAGTIDVAAAIIAESTLSFLGLGFPPDVPTWGRVLFDAKDYLDIAPHWALFPGAAIFLTVLSINFIGDGLRDALDPRRVL